ncbi:unnamed protein product [Effrenium voratum]|uniref:Uncharacterized protein n=1 Tax=Effrenium voratum TaxID=2562239 RepID=A0AA36NCJ5_9DINO|nr:unnamed protein product [Effrenium voratum]
MVLVSAVQKFLKLQCYMWVPRAQKRKYTATHMRERKDFAQAVLSLSMDGCVLPPPPKANGPWHLLCDNESFLNAADCQAEYRKWKLHLREIPQLDMNDALKRRPVLSKMAHKARIRS